MLLLTLPPRVRLGHVQNYYVREHRVRYRADAKLDKTSRMQDEVRRTVTVLREE